MPNLPELRLPRKKSRVVLQVVGSVCFVVLGVFVTLLGLRPSSPDPVYVIVGVLAIVVFGFFAVLIGSMMRRPALVVDDRGIRDATSGLSIGFIPWEQALGFQPQVIVTEVGAVEASNDYVAVIWADEQWPWAQMGARARWLNRANKKVGTPTGPISADLLHVTGEQLALMLLEQRRARRPELPEAPGMPRTGTAASGGSSEGPA